MLLADYFRERESTKEQEALAELIRETIHEEFGLAHCVQKGIGYHFSDVPTVVRHAVEEAAATGVLDFIVCTSTLLQGVNLPAKNIFMLAPTKGKDRPLLSTDFWNLAGRAGRLGREFHGNIFLIAYDEWAEKPLNGPRETVLVSALEWSVTSERKKLLSVVRDEQVEDNPDMETAFGRLFVDLKEGRLNKTLDRLSISNDTYKEIVIALYDASTETNIPIDVLKQTPNISPHKQQRLFDEIVHEIREQNIIAVRKLTPRHPQDFHAYDSYKDVLHRCHRVLLGLENSRLHEFHALLAVWWSRGVPLPQIVQERLNRLKPSANRASNIRETLELIEKDIRFTTVRLLGCYTSTLIQALKETGFETHVASVPSLGLYLEVGAHARTMISLMSLGLSRVVAGRLTEAASDKNMDLAATRAWIKVAPIEALGLSLLLRQEIYRLRSGIAA